MKIWIKPWFKRTLFGLFGASLLFGGLAACSHHRHGDHWQMSEADSAKMRERFIDKASSTLSLDETQRASLGRVADAVKAQRAALLAGTPEPRAQLQALLAGPHFDRAKAQALLDDKLLAVRDRAPAVLQALADFYDGLRPEQQQKLRELMNRGRERHDRS